MSTVTASNGTPLMASAQRTRHDADESQNVYRTGRSMAATLPANTPAYHLESMWIIRLALRRPYTVLTLCLLVMLFGGLSMTRMQRDILPNIDIPVVIVIWNYPGLPADEVERRIVYITERALSTTVS